MQQSTCVAKHLERKQAREVVKSGFGNPAQLPLGTWYLRNLQFFYLRVKMMIARNSESHCED